MPLSHVQECSNGNNISDQLDIASLVLDYRNLQPIHSKIWSRSHTATSLYRIEETRPIDIENLILLLCRINVFLRCNPMERKTVPTGFDSIAEQLLYLIQAVFLSR